MSFEVHVVASRPGLMAELRAIPSKLKKAQEKGLLRAAIALRDEIVLKLTQGSTSRTLGVRSGDLRRSWIRGLHHVNPNLIRIASDLPYAAIHEFGGTIVPKTPGGWLVFRVQKEDGGWGWVKVRKVVMPQRPYVGPALKDAGPIMQREIDKAVEAALKVK